MHGNQRRNVYVVTDFANLIHLDRGRPPGPELAGDFDAGNALEPGTDFYLRSVIGAYLRQERRTLVMRFVFSVFSMHVLQDRIEAAARFEQRENFLHEQREIRRIGKTADDIRNDAEPPQFFRANTRAGFC